MDKHLKVKQSIEINSSAEKVWEVLTNPEKIKNYLFGTKTITDWKIGSTIVFQGNYEGHQYKDKGNVVENIKNKVLSYNYWSGFSGLEDKIENYSLVTYKIEMLKENKVKFSWIQQGFANIESQNHTKFSLNTMLEKIKTLAED